MNFLYIVFKRGFFVEFDFILFYNASMKNKNIEECLNKLSASKFRASFHLKKDDKLYYEKKGKDVIRSHAIDFVVQRLSPSFPKNDGKQTPMHGHPVFVAQHATATCCRGCFEKWYGTKRGVAMSKEEIDFAVNLIMAWIEREMKNQ